MINSDFSNVLLTHKLQSTSISYFGLNPFSTFGSNTQSIWPTKISYNRMKFSSLDGLTYSNKNITWTRLLNLYNYRYKIRSFYFRSFELKFSNISETMHPLLALVRSTLSRDCSTWLIKVLILQSIIAFDFKIKVLSGYVALIKLYWSITCEICNNFDAFCNSSKPIIL